MRETKRTQNELWRARDSVRRHDAAVVFSIDRKPSVHAPEEEDFGKVYNKALERLAQRNKNKLHN